MDEEPNVCIDISLLEIKWSQEKMDVVDPDHVLLLFNLNKILCEDVIDLTISVPHLSILLINLIFVISFKVVEKWSQKLLIK